MKTTLRCTETDDELHITPKTLKRAVKGYIESLTESEPITDLNITNSGTDLIATYRFDGCLNTLHFTTVEGD